MIATAQREDAATEERINAILSEAQIAMQAKTSQDRVGFNSNRNLLFYYGW